MSEFRGEARRRRNAAAVLPGQLFSVTSSGLKLNVMSHFCERIFNFCFNFNFNYLSDFTFFIALFNVNINVHLSFLAYNKIA